MSDLQASGRISGESCYSNRDDLPFNDSKDERAKVSVMLAASANLSHSFEKVT